MKIVWNKKTQTQAINKCLGQTLTYYLRYIRCIYNVI